ncbi:MAG: hypothetical protein AB7V50_06830 [Vampirovibrionia bacterium]
MSLNVSLKNHSFGSNNTIKNLQLQPLIDRVDPSLIKTQKLRDSFESVSSGIKPVVVVIDDLNTIDTDINGDNINDLSHCEMVSLYVTDNASVIPVNIDMTSGVRSVNNLIEIFNTIKNDAQVDAINLSIGLDFNKAYFNELFKDVPADKIKQAILNHSEYSYNNFVELKESYNKETDDVVKARKGFLLKLAAYYPVLKKLSTLPEIDTPVYISGTNSSSTINILSYFLNNPVRIDKPEANTFYITEKTIDGKVLGYDVNNDNIVDVLKKEVSTGFPLVKKFAGASPEQFIMPENLLKSLLSVLLKPIKAPDKVLGEVKNYILSSAQLERLMNNLNHVKGGFYFVPEVNDTNSSFSLNLFKHLILDKDGKLYFGPPDFSVKNAVNKLFGNSYLTPHIMSKDILSGKIQKK